MQPTDLLRNPSSHIIIETNPKQSREVVSASQAPVQQRREQ